MNPFNGTFQQHRWLNDCPPSSRCTLLYTKTRRANSAEPKMCPHQTVHFPIKVGFSHTTNSGRQAKDKLVTESGSSALSMWSYSYIYNKISLPWWLVIPRIATSSSSAFWCRSDRTDRAWSGLVQQLGHNFNFLPQEVVEMIGTCQLVEIGTPVEQFCWRSQLDWSSPWKVTEDWSFYGAIPFGVKRADWRFF